ncbi:Trehalose/maltose import ATP-binding protein MalK [uncultured archaeon]|nr:Trehalose/maltose import ATP-binding protein MalK [uncultured archaeon]
MSSPSNPSAGRSSPYAIELNGLTRRFGSFIAVDGLSLKVKKGELFGFLGPNGAGKTTTINMLTTLLKPTEGSALVAGYDLSEEDALVRSRIGVVPQKFSLFEELTPLENLWYIGELYSMDRSLVQRRSEELLKIVTLYDKRDVRSGTFSGGMKQRLSVAAGLLHSPEILFMDEPPTGLDPQSRIALRELTQTLNASGMTVIYTTHDMDEADKLCDRIGIMDHGKLIALGTSAELKSSQHYSHCIEIEFERVPEQKLLDELKALVGAISVSLEGRRASLPVRRLPPDLIHKLSDFLSRRRISTRDFKVREPTLEEVFINLTKKELRD